MSKGETVTVVPANAALDGRRERGERRRRAIVDAARDLFIEFGYRGTTLDAIIARAGGSRETIYRSFGGKRGLFGTIVETVGAGLAAEATAPAALELPPREGLTRFGLRLAAIWHSDEGRAVNRAVVSEGLDAPELVEAWYRGGTERSIAALARYLAHQQDLGHLKPLNGEIVARHYVILVMGELGYPLVSGIRDDGGIPAAIGRCVDLILAAYEI